MDDAKGSKEESAQAGEVKKPAGNKPIVMGIIAGVIILNAVLGFLLINATKPKAADDKHEKVQEDSLKHAAEEATAMGATTAEAPIDVITNISGTDGTRFLKISVIFEYDDVAFPELGAELEHRTPKIRDLFLNHVSRQTLADLSGPDSKDNLRNEMLRLVNATLPSHSGAVREVLFTTYIIQ